MRTHPARTILTACLLLFVVHACGLFFTVLGHLQLWRMGVGTIRADALADGSQSWDDMPDLMGQPITTLQVRVVRLVPFAEHFSAHGPDYSPARLLPGCTDFYWLGDLPILIGVRDGTVLRTIHLKG